MLYIGVLPQNDFNAEKVTFYEKGMNLKNRRTWKTATNEKHLLHETGVFPEKEILLKNGRRIRKYYPLWKKTNLKNKSTFFKPEKPSSNMKKENNLKQIPPFREKNMSQPCWSHFRSWRKNDMDALTPSKSKLTKMEDYPTSTKTVKDANN